MSSKSVMKTKKLFSGFEVPVLGFGTFAIGGEHEADYSNDEKYINAIKDALDLGYTHNRRNNESA